MPAAVASAPMSKQAAMSLYTDRRQRTSVLQLDSTQTYRRADVIAIVSQTVGCMKVEAVGQLQNNSTWEVVFRDEAAKKLFVDREIAVRGKKASVVELQRRVHRMRILRVPTCIPNEYLASRLNGMGMVVRDVMNEVNQDDGLMSNVRIGTFECRDLDAVPDVIQWQFDGLSGRALLFVQGRPPRCHRCGDRTHKVAQCRSAVSYANAMRGGTIDNDDFDETDETEAQPPSVAMQPSAAQPADDTATATASESTTQAATTASASAGAEMEIATEPTASAAEVPAATAADTASTSATVIAVSASDMSDGDGDDEHSDGDGDTSDAGEPTMDVEGFRQPTAHARRQRRSNKRSAVNVSDANGRPKKTKGHQSVSDCDKPDEMDPTRRRQSWSKIPTSRRK